MEWLVNLRIERDADGWRLSTPLDPEPSRLIPAGDGLYTLSGRGMLDGAYVLVDGDRLFAGFVGAERVGWWQSARALVAYASLALLALLGAGGWLGLRWLRRRRARALS